MKEAVFEELHYYSGLAATGCWDTMDEYDQEAIRCFGDMIIEKTIRLAQAEAERFYGMNEDELSSVMENFQELLKHYFGVE